MLIMYILIYILENSINQYKLWFLVINNISTGHVRVFYVRMSGRLINEQARIIF